MPKKEVITRPKQMEMDLQIEREVEIDGIGMGVLTDGTPYLTARGLARMCGVDHTLILRMASEWKSDKPPPRVTKVLDALQQQGISLERPYIELQTSGSLHHAYPDVVCMAVLEYYAFDARQSDREIALRNFRLLARRSFRAFIYDQVGYDPQGLLPVAWRQFHDRVTAAYGSVPHGYFSVFKELADVIVTLIRGGADIGAHFVPDISVGIAWSKHWRANDFDTVFGERRKYPHNYPRYFPQAPSNPQDAYCYPDEALGEFRRWMRTEYLIEKLPSYLQNKVREGALPPSFAEVARTVLIDAKPES